MHKVEIYTDGSCLDSSSGPGAYASVLYFGNKTKTIAQGFKETTNQRMELMAVVEALRALKTSCRVTLYSDSKYVTDSISKKWLDRWVACHWKPSMGSKKNIKNTDLWQQVYDLLKEHETEFKWVKGHANTEGNIIADKIAQDTAHGTNLIDDEGFLESRTQIDEQMDLF